MDPPRPSLPHGVNGSSDQQPLEGRSSTYFPPRGVRRRLKCLSQCERNRHKLERRSTLCSMGSNVGTSAGTGHICDSPWHPPIVRLRYISQCSSVVACRSLPLATTYHDEGRLDRRCGCSARQRTLHLSRSHLRLYRLCRLAIRPEDGQLPK